jgi:hypothetical protein
MARNSGMSYNRLLLFRDFLDSDLQEEEDFMSYILSTQSMT